MARPIKPQSTEMVKKVVQSYIVSAAKFKYTLTEQRIKYALLENLSRMGGLQGLEYRNKMFRLYRPSATARTWEVEIPMSDILKYMGDEQSPKKNQALIRKAARSMQTKIIEVENTLTGEYWGAALIMNVYIGRGSSIMKFCVADWVMAVLMDLTKGVRQFEYQTIMAMKSPYSQRMYELVAEQKQPRTLTVEKFREWFGIKDGQYTRSYDLRKRVIEPSKKELDACCPYTFDYTEVKEVEGSKTSPVVAYIIYPKHQADKEAPNIVADKYRPQLTASNIIGNGETYRYLTHELAFKASELNRNKKTIEDGVKYIPDFYGFLHEIAGPSREAKNPQGYVINAIKQATIEAKEGKQSITPADKTRAAQVQKKTAQIVKQLSIFVDSK